MDDYNLDQFIGLGFTRDTARLVSAFCRDWFFLVFWAATAAAFIWRRPRIRQSYLVFFFGTMVLVGLTGWPLLAWPFHNWHLWGRIIGEQSEYYELCLEDAHGNVVVYDPRAVSPVPSAILNMRIATQLWHHADEPEWREMANWLLDRARHHQPLAQGRTHLGRGKGESGHYECEGFYDGTYVTPHWPEHPDEFVAVVVRKRHALWGRAPAGSIYTIEGQRRFP